MAPDVSIPVLNLHSRAEKGAEILDALAAQKKVMGPRFPRIWFDDARFDPDSNYFIKNLFHGRRLIVVYGPSGEGKTFWIIDWRRDGGAASRA